MKKFFFSLSLLFSLSSFAQVSEQQQQGSHNPNTANDPAGPRTMVGMALGHQSPIYKYGNVSYPYLPFLSIYYDDFYLKGLSLGYQIPTHFPRFYLELSPFLQGIKDSDYESRGIKERKWTLMAGGGMTLPSNILSANLDLKWDTLGRAKSGFATLSIYHAFTPLKNRLRLTPGFMFRYYDKKFVDYYYGVSSSESSSRRPAFQGKAATEYGPMLNLGYRINTRWLFIASGSYYWFDKNISNSPLVTSSKHYSWYTGFGYSL